MIAEESSDRKTLLKIAVVRMVVIVMFDFVRAIGVKHDGGNALPSHVGRQ
jgi:hypothetical protein